MDTVVVKLAGEELVLPVRFREYEALDRLGLCPYKLFTDATIRGVPPGLSVPQAANTVAVGLMQHEDKSKRKTPEMLWQQARVTERGCGELVNAGLAYMAAFLSALDDTEAPKVGGQGDPKA